MFSIIVVIMSGLLFTEESRADVAVSYRVIDGDTIVLNNEKIRLFGIDAPEFNQDCLDEKGRAWACGKAAKAFLEGLTIGNDLKCNTVTKDKYKRSLGICFRDSINLNQSIVRAGYALAYFRYSDLYKFDQEYARENEKGIWKGTFKLPEDFRKSKKTKAIKKD